MTNLINDISVLTDVSENTLNKFVPLCTYCIGHAVHEGQCSQDNISEIDLGYGELHIKVDDDCIRYKFIPSKELEKTILQTLKTRRSPIVTKIETNLQEKIDRVYKELL